MIYVNKGHINTRRPQKKYYYNNNNDNNDNNNKKKNLAVKDYSVYQQVNVVVCVCWLQ